MKLKLPCVLKKLTKAYDPLFRNTREKRDNTREKIFEIYNVPYLEKHKTGLCFAEGLEALPPRFESRLSKQFFISNSLFKVFFLIIVIFLGKF